MVFHGAIFDVDGVLVDSPHELAWRESLRELMAGPWRDLREHTTYEPERFTSMLYQRVIAGLPRLAGARAALEHFGVPDVERRAKEYAEAKQRRVVELIEAGQFMAFADALRFVLAVKRAGILVASASSSKNANRFLRKIRIDTFAAEQRLGDELTGQGRTLLDLFDADVAGRDFPRGKPDPMIFLTAAEELGVSPSACFVVEDAPSGIEAAKAGGMAAIGVARRGDRELLEAAGADLVVASLDDISLEALAAGRLEERTAAVERRRRRESRSVNVWALTYEGFDPERQGLREALCALGNGYFVTRGALPEATADGVNYPGTYVAGLYNRLRTDLAGRTFEHEDLVNVPNWLPLSFRVASGPWFDVRDADLLDHRYTLDLRQGTLTRHLRWQDPEGRRTAVVQRRFVSMQDPHLAGLETTFTAENWSGTLEVRSGIDGSVVNAGVRRYRDLDGHHLRVLDTGDDDDLVELQAETVQSKVRVALAARTRLLRDGQPVTAERRVVTEPGRIAHDLTLTLEAGRPLTVEKIVALYTSRDRAISESRLAAHDAARDADGFDGLLARHAGAWERLWNRLDIELDCGNDWAEMVLHLHIFHLLQTVSPNSIKLDIGVPARGWHGEAYRGHIFWDELFVFPFLNFQRPILARSLLDYRYERLGAARAAARAAGYRGALFPWQSGSDGREETPEVHLNPRSGRWLPDNSHLQRHVNSAIAYNVWQHFLVTGNLQFLRFTGAELLIEIARLWASLATYNPRLDRYEILGVMGPDEYHDAYPGSDRPGIDNNTYTNVMAVWSIQRALEALEVLPPHYRQEVVEALGIEAEELQRWQEITRKMRVVFHDDGVLTQFEGYDQLLEFDWDGYRARYGNIQRLDRVLEAEGDSTNRYKVSKQADVLMLLFLLSRDELRALLRDLGYEVTEAQLDRTIDYYLARTSHGSTLSGVVSSWVLARSDSRQAWRFLLKALESDIADVQGGTTPEGIHLGAMAGTVDIVQRGLTGMRVLGNVLRFAPVLPPEMRSLRFSVHFRGHRIEVELDGEQMRLSSRPGRAAPIEVLVGERRAWLAPGGQAEFKLEGQGLG